MKKRLLLSLSLVGLVGCSFAKSSTGPTTGTTDAKTAATATVPKNLVGTVGEYPIRMTLAQDGTKLSGTYEYTRVGKPIKLVGTVVGRELKLTESDDAGKPTGTFAITYDTDTAIGGEWTSAKGKKLALSLRASASASAAQASPGSVEVKESVVKIQRGKKGQEFPDYKTAELHFPLVSGLPDAGVMAKVQEAVSLKAVFGQTAEEMRKEFQEEWSLDSIEYQINFNKSDIFSMTYTQCGTGAYPSCGDDYVNVNLKTGGAITPDTAFSNVSGLAKLVDGALRAEIRKTLADAKTDKDIDEEGRSFLESQLNGEDSGVKEPVDAERLKQFIVGEKGITFVYDYGFPHVGKALEPPGRFFFSWQTLTPYLKPDGAFGQFVK